MPVPETDTVPPVDGWVSQVMESVSHVSESVSLVRTGMTKLVSSVPVAVSANTTGVSAIQETVIEPVAADEVHPLLSVA